jgi:hypothetical protein
MIPSFADVGSSRISIEVLGGKGLIGNMVW